MIVAGSSLQVWPVAGLPGLTLAAGGRLAVVTSPRPSTTRPRPLVERAPTEEALPALVARLEECRAAARVASWRVAVRPRSPFPC